MVNKPNEEAVYIQPSKLLNKLFCLNGAPFSIDEYPYLQDIYDTNAREVGLFTGRQCSKSTFLASKAVMEAVIDSPGSHQILVTPLQDQAYVFSTTRLKDFIYDSPLIRNGFFSGPNVIDQMLRKQFNNGNMISLGYAQRTADRLRGRSARKIKYDECCRFDTNLQLLGGSTIWISKAKVGDKIEAFDEAGNVQADEIEAVVNKGVRPTFKVVLENGLSLICTENEKFYSTSGWIYLHEMLTSNTEKTETRLPESTPDSVITGVTIGRRMYGVGTTQRQVLGTARPDSKRILRPQIHGVGKSIQPSTEDNCQRWMGGVFSCVQDPREPSIQLYTRNLLLSKTAAISGTDEICVPEMARQTDLGGPDVLVHGRRFAGQQGQDNIQYTRVHETRSSTVGAEIKVDGNIERRFASQKERQDLLHPKLESGLNNFVSKKYTRVCPPQHAVQMGCETTPNKMLSLVSHRVQSEEQPSDSRFSDLPQSTLSRQTGSCVHETSASPCGTARSENGTQFKGQTEVCRFDDHREIQTKGLPNPVSLQRGEQGNTTSSPQSLATEEREQSHLSSQAERRETALLRTEDGRPCTLPYGRGTITETEIETRSENSRTGTSETMAARQSGVVSSPAGACKSEPALVPVKIVSIKYVGMEEVWDIRTKKHHTFFANGIAVHNCQDIFPDVIPIIREMAFRRPDANFWYCGTPKTLNNHMEKYRNRSTGGEWAAKCAEMGCGHWNYAWTEKNIGPTGVVCEKCQKPIDTDRGQWIAARSMDNELGLNSKCTMESYRIAQLIVKPIMDNPVGWRELLTKFKEYSTEQFNNEVLALPFDGGTQPVTEAQLRACCSTRHNVMPAPNDSTLPSLVLGVDWAFKGEESYTFVTVGAWVSFPHKFKVYFWKIFKGVESDSLYQVQWIKDHVTRHNMKLIGADWGAGHVQNLMLINHFGENAVAQMWHTGMKSAGGSKSQNRAKYEPRTRKWHLARTAVLTDTFEDLRNARIEFPRFEECEELFKHILAESLEFDVRTNRASYNNVEPDDGLHSLCYAQLAGELLIKGGFGGHLGSDTSTSSVVSDGNFDIWNEDTFPVGDGFYQ